MSSEKKYHQIITTLYEKHYDYGVAALVNSIVESGFEGAIVVGYKGELPFWIDQLERNEGCYKVSDRISLLFIKVDSDMHLGYYKPYFLWECLSQFELCEKIYYFDPDIVLTGPWSFYSEWVESGISLCIDVSFPFIHHRHPWRAKWAELGGVPLSQTGFNDFYANSGYLGIKRSDILILDKWIQLTDIYKSHGGNCKSFDQGLTHTAFKGDQDLLNATITLLGKQVEYSVLGSEGMGFTEPGYLMYHAIGNKHKPWKKKFVANVILINQKPSIAESYYFNYVSVPINVFSKSTLFFKKLDLKAAKLLGRVLG